MENKKSTFYHESKKVWVKHYGPIPPGLQIHHVIPRVLGGTNDILNLELLTRDEHIEKHRILAEETKHPLLVSAYKIMSKQELSDKDFYELRRMCGRLGGQKAVESGQLASVRNPSKGGKAVFEQRKDEILNRLNNIRTRETCARGGHTQGVINLKNGNLENMWSKNRKTYKLVRDIDGHTIMTNNIIEECKNNKDLYVNGVTPLNRAKNLRRSAIQNNRIIFGWRCYKV